MNIEAYSAPAPGIIQFSASSYSTYEGYNGWEYVERIGGSDGIVTVDYATVDDTAIAGIHYAAKSGTLTWGDGDTANKAFPVTIANDSTYNGYLYFSYVLSNPTGGAVIGEQNPLTVQLRDNDTPPVPTGLKATAGNKKVDLSWNPVNSAFYKLCYSTVNGDFTEDNSVSIYEGETYTLTGLKNGTTYYFAIKAGHDMYYSALSDSISATPKAPSSGGGGGGGALPGFAIRASGSVVEKYGAIIDVPAGAVGADTRGDIERFDNDYIDTPEDSFIPGHIFAFTKNSSGKFKNPITVTLPYDPKVVDLKKYSLSVCWYDEAMDKWVELDNVKVDEETLTVSGETVESGHFAVIAIPKEVVPVPPALTDIKGHWAETAILSLVGRQAIDGYPDGSFKPQQTITRAEFATVLVKALGLQAQSGKMFEDTTRHWAKDYIRTAYAADIIEGYDAEHFGPDDLITREQMAVMIIKATGLMAADQELTFSDSAEVSPWAVNWVRTAAHHGLMKGYTDDSFKPLANASRAEAVIVIFNVLAK